MQHIAQLVLPYLDEELEDTRRLDAMIEGAQRACRAMHEERGYRRWYVMYSGGKDSTATAVLCMEALRGTDAHLEVIYCDTMLEIPTLHAHAMQFLSHLQSRGVNTRILTRKEEDSFWVLLIGKGYVAPHRLFRWCTERLKIRPVQEYLRSLGHDPREVLIVTGVRFGESDARNLRLKLSCARGGECGQGVWYEQAGRIGYGYFSPIVVWRECDVWDYLTLVAPTLGYPTAELAQVYQSSQSRFGCWTCTVVQRDRAMESLVQVRPEYTAMLQLRNWLKEFTADPANRVMKPNGVPGRLTLAARREILQRVEGTEQALGTTILSTSERELIQQYWEMYGDAY